MNGLIECGIFASVALWAWAAARARDFSSAMFLTKAGLKCPSTKLCGKRHALRGRKRKKRRTRLRYPRCWFTTWSDPERGITTSTGKTPSITRATLEWSCSTRTADWWAWSKTAEWRWCRTQICRRWWPNLLRWPLLLLLQGDVLKQI